MSGSDEKGKGRRRGFATRGIHAGQAPDPSTGAVMPPIYATSTYAQASPGDHQGYEYSRSQNPTRMAFERCIADLESGTQGFAFASGMAAIATALELLDAGSHVVAMDDLYGGSGRLFDRVRSRSAGLSFTYADLSEPAALAAAIRPETRMIWVETPTNPMLKLIDLRKIVGLGHAHNALVAADSVLVPLQTEYYALEGLSALLATVQQIKDHRNPRLEMEGIVINQFNSQARLPGELVAELEEEGYQVFDTYLNTSVKMKESHRDHRPLIELAPSHKLTAQFLDLHAELEKTLSRAAA